METVRGPALVTPAVHGFLTGKMHLLHREKSGREAQQSMRYLIPLLSHFGCADIWDLLEIICYLIHVV